MSILNNMFVNVIVKLKQLNIATYASLLLSIPFIFFFLYRRSSAIMSWSSTHVLFGSLGHLLWGGHPNVHFRWYRWQGSNPCRPNLNNKCLCLNHVGHLDPLFISIWLTLAQSELAIPLQTVRSLSHMQRKNK